MSKESYKRPTTFPGLGKHDNGVINVPDDAIVPHLSAVVQKLLLASALDEATKQNSEKSVPHYIYYRWSLYLGLLRMCFRCWPFRIWGFPEKAAVGVGFFFFLKKLLLVSAVDERHQKQNLIPSHCDIIW